MGADVGNQGVDVCEGKKRGVGELFVCSIVVDGIDGEQSTTASQPRLIYPILKSF
jgi:hypothetical protein